MAKKFSLSIRIIKRTLQNAAVNTMIYSQVSQPRTLILGGIKNAEVSRALIGIKKEGTKIFSVQD